MKQTWLLTSALALLLVFGACMRQPDAAGLKKTVDEFNAASIKSMQSGDVESVIGYYADNATEMPPNMEAVMGKAAIGDWMKKMSASGVKISKAAFSVVETGVGGTIGYEIGTYDMTMDVPDMGTVNDKGKYISLWTQENDGSWKVRAEIWNSDNPVPGVKM